MDGNGRWAKAKGLPRIAGHYEGAKVAERIVKYSRKLGIAHLTLFAFSTENWKRPKEEIELLFELLEKYLIQKKEELYSLRIKVRFIGRRDRLPQSLKKLMDSIEEESRHMVGMTLNLAVDYGGRDDIVRAVNRVLREGKRAVDEEGLTKMVDLYPSPDPDLMIRTSGERRISNFLLWNLAYTELYFTDTLWPDFTEEDLLQAIQDYSSRKRKFGGILNE
jgi:undecaprenyl diphosphate synthase